jgi:hypothetical protein
MPNLPWRSHSQMVGRNHPDQNHTTDFTGGAALAILLFNLFAVVG